MDTLAQENGTDSRERVGLLQSSLASPRLQSLLRVFIGILSLAFLLLFLYTALRRMRYPFELEWIESGVLVSVRRIAQGRGLYGAPSINFVPFLYSPLYLYLVAALTLFLDNPKRIANLWQGSQVETCPCKTAKTEPIWIEHGVLPR